MNFFGKLKNSRVIYDSDKFWFIICILFMIVTFNDVKQDKMIINVSFKDSIEKIIIDAVVICKDVIYQSTGTWVLWNFLHLKVHYVPCITRLAMFHAVLLKK